jgi:hypothetical protein
LESEDSLPEVSNLTFWQIMLDLVIISFLLLARLALNFMQDNFHEPINQLTDAAFFDR